MEVARLRAFIEFVGMQAFEKDADRGKKATDKIGDSADDAGKKTGKFGDQVDASGKKVGASATGADKAASSNKKLGESSEQAGAGAEKLGSKTEEMAAEVESAHNRVGASMAGIGAGILAMVGGAVAKYASFDKAMSEVQATTRGTADEQRALRDAAIEAGSETVFTAEKAAQAQIELSKAGVATADILSGGLSGALSLAAAGQLDVADAAEIASTALVQFKLEGSDVPHVADLLAAGAGKAQGSVQDLSYALKQSGLVASQAGLSVEETTGTLAAFASAGLLGSDAGTSFRTMLLALMNPTDKAAAVMKQYGINAYDANGEMVSMSNLAGQLKGKLGDVEQAERNKAMATIFGSDAIRAANVLYDQGADGMNTWTNEVNESGYAARQAAEMQNNLTGDIEKLGGAFDSGIIKSGTGANDVLRQLVQGATGLVELFGGLPAPVLQAGLVIAGLVGGVLLLGGTFLLAVPKIVEYRMALETLNTAYPKVTQAGKSAAAFLTGPWGIAITAAMTILAAFAGSQAEAKGRVDSLTSTLDEQTGAFTDATEAAVRKRLQDEGVYSAAERAGISMEQVTRAAMGNKDAYEQVNKKASDWYQTLSFTERVLGGGGMAYDALTGNVSRLSDELGQASDAQKNMAAGATETADAAATSAEGSQVMADGFANTDQMAEDLDTTLGEILNSINELNEAAISSEESQIAYQDQLAKIAEYVDKAKAGTDGYKLSLDQNTQAGRDNYGMLLDQAKAAQDAADKQMKAGGSVDDYRKRMEASRGTFIDNLMLFGKTREEANSIADAVFKIPSEKEINTVVNGAETAIDKLNRINAAAQSAAQQVISATSKLTGTFDDNTPKGRNNAQGGIDVPARFFAAGGMNTSRNVSRLAQAGEAVIWNEEPSWPETFISNNPAYRARSEQVLRQQAAMFGMRVVDGTEPAGSTATATLSPETRIRGTLDLGNGLTGLIDAIVQGRLDDENETAGKGIR